MATKSQSITEGSREAEAMLSELAQSAFLYKAEPPAPEQLFAQGAVPAPSVIIITILP